MYSFYLICACISIRVPLRCFGVGRHQQANRHSLSEGAAGMKPAGAMLAPDQPTTASPSEDESMYYTCDSMESPELEFTDDEDCSAGDSNDSAVMLSEIYNHLRNSENKKRPWARYMESVQKDIDANMRAITIEWLAEVADCCMLVPEVLHLAVNYMDRYLSCDDINRFSLQLLGAAAMLIASKHEERSSAVTADKLCYLTNDGYTKEQMLWMEADVLRCLRFEVTVPTAQCFLGVFVPLARGPPRLGFVADYIAALSLLDYNMICYAPSMVAAASVFLANSILQPNDDPWSHELSTLYPPSDLRACVEDLRLLLCDGRVSNLPVILKKRCHAFTAA